MTGRLYAGLDVGTNSTKLIVAELFPEPRGRYEETIMTRLGEGMQASSPRLREVPMRRTLDAIQYLAEKAKEYGSIKIAAVGTAALRDAGNRDEFLHRVKERAGLDLEVIGGEEEARLSYLAGRLDPFWSQCDPLMVCDIGGGSSEVILGEPGSHEINSRLSVPLGAVRVTERFLKSDPPTIAQLAAAHKAAFTACQNLPVGPIGQEAVLVGVGGTVTNLGAMDRADQKLAVELHGFQLRADRLEMLLERLATHSVAARREMPGLDPQRADIILGGALMLSQIMAHIGVSVVNVSTRGLKWGLLYDRFLHQEQK